MPCSTDCALLPRNGRGRRNGSPGDPSAAGDVGSLDHLLALQANRQAVDIGVGLAAVVSDAVDELGGRLATTIAVPGAFSHLSLAFVDHRRASCRQRVVTST